MPETFTKRRWKNGVLIDDTFTVSSSSSVTSPTALYDIVLAKFSDYGMTDDNIPGNAAMTAVATSIATQAQNDSLLV